MCPWLAPHVGYVGEDERLSFIKSNSNDVLCIFVGKSMCLLYREVLPEELLIVGQLNNKGNIKHILQVPWQQEEGTGVKGAAKGQSAAVGRLKLQLIRRCHDRDGRHAEEGDAHRV